MDLEELSDILQIRKSYKGDAAVGVTMCATKWVQETTNRANGSSNNQEEDPDGSNNQRIDKEGYQQ